MSGLGQSTQEPLWVVSGRKPYTLQAIQTAGSLGMVPNPLRTRTTATQPRDGWPMLADPDLCA